MDTEKILAALMKAAGLDPKKSSTTDLKNAIDAYEKLGLALKGASKEEPAEESAEEPAAEEASPPEELSAPGVPALSADSATVVKASTETPNPAPAPTATAETPAAETTVALADSPEALDAAGKQVLDKLMQALGMDAAGCVAFVGDNLDKLAALAGKQPESGQPSDKPADGAPALAAPAVAASAIQKADAVRLSAVESELAKERAKSAKLSADLEAKTKADTEAAIKASVNKAIESGRVLEVERETLTALALSAGIEVFESYIAKRPPAVITTRVMSAETPAAPPADETKLTREQLYAFNFQLNSGATREHALKRALEMKSSA